MIDEALEEVYDSVSLLIPQLQSLLDDIDKMRDDDPNEIPVSTYRIEEMINIEQEEVDKGIYVWGGNGQNMNDMDDPEKWVRRRESSYSKDSSVVEKNVKRVMALYNERKAKGIDPIRAFDCSGLQYFAGNKVGVFPNDLNARGIFAKCVQIKKDELKRGDFVFIHNGSKISHVGLYIGGNKVIECLGRDDGVVVSNLTDRFNRYGRLTDLWKQ